MEASGLLPEGAGAQAVLRMLEVYRSNLRLMHTGSAEPLPPIPVVLFRAADPMPGQSSAGPSGADLGWDRQSILPVAIHQVPGNHLTLVQPPQAAVLASTLMAELPWP
jgi:thioesterase domain-containing protein